MRSIPELIRLAMEHYRGGRPREAERLVQKILEAVPEHAGANHLLGVIAYQFGRYELAIELISRALRADPNKAEPHNNLGLALSALNRRDEAIACYRQAIQCHAGFAEAHGNLGNMLRDQGNMAEAAACYQVALRYRPDLAEAHCNLGNIVRDQGSLAEAVNCYREALRYRPDFAEAHYNLALTFQGLDRRAEAELHFRQAIRHKADFAEAHHNLGNLRKRDGCVTEALANYAAALRYKPDFPEALNNLAVVLLEQGRTEEALASLERAVTLQTDFAEAYSNLGIAYKGLDRPDHAAKAWRRALSLNPELAEAHNGLGTLLHDQGQLDESFAFYKEALRCNPAFAQAHNNLGAVLYEKGSLENAARHFRDAVRYQPDLATAHYNLATIQLHVGDFERGWPEYEWRWKIPSLTSAVRHVGRTPWRGEHLPKSTILLHAEQGYGDAIQFVRFATLVKQRVGTVYLECPRALVTLLQSVPGVDKVVPFGEPLPPFDVQAPLMSLPARLQTTMTSIPAAIPYVHAPAAVTDIQRQVLLPEDSFKIGIVWQTGLNTMNTQAKRRSEQKSLPLARFESLARLPGVRLISLQKDLEPESVIELLDLLGIGELGSTITNFRDTAAVIQNLDLIITADTATAHLAGALGVPVWVVLPFASCWRWLEHRDDSPWYATMRLFRQQGPGEWAEVFDRITREVVALTNSRVLSSSTRL